MLPNNFTTHINNTVGFNEKEFLAAMSEKPLTSIRINLQKTNDTAAILDQFGGATPVAWCSSGYYLKERPSFIFDPLWHAGAYYVQEASSMFIEHVVKQLLDFSTPLTLLDLCAAPGGKSTLLQSLLNNESVLVANEVIKTRVAILEENIIKWGSHNTIVTNSDPKQFANLPNTFDVILLDAPCSGSGMFRKDEEAYQEWSPEHVNLCAQRQKRIIADAWPCLKDDGYLIYSTCSFSEEENEAIVDWALENFKATTIDISYHHQWGITKTQSKNNQGVGYRFWPHLTQGEGLFLTILQKKENITNPKRTDPKVKKNKSKEKIYQLTEKNKELLLAFYEPKPTDIFLQHQEALLKITQSLAEVLAKLKPFVYIKYLGVTLGDLHEKTFIPHHALALMTNYPNNLAKVNLDKATAIEYLQTKTLHVALHQKGWGLAQHQGYNLGWLKYVGNRTNNYYPKPYRILSEYKG
jgi:NOL1/NOP2/sun family putative RNA methylase